MLLAAVLKDPLHAVLSVMFARSDFQRLADLLSQIEGQFILTINANGESRRIFDRFEVDKVDTTYTISTAASGAGKRVKELIVQNRRAGPATFDFGT